MNEQWEIDDVSLSSTDSDTPRILRAIAESSSVHSTFEVEEPTLKQEHIDRFCQTFPQPHSVQRVWLHLEYTAALKEEFTTSTTKRCLAIVYPGSPTDDSLRVALHQTYEKITDGLNGSGWSVLMIHAICWSAYNNPAKLKVDKQKSNWTVQCKPEESLSYAVYSLLHPAEKDKARKTKYKNITNISPSIETNAEHYKRNVAVYTMDPQGMASLAMLTTHAEYDANGPLLVVMYDEQKGLYTSCPKGLYCERNVICPHCQQVCDSKQLKGHIKAMHNHEIVLCPGDIQWDDMKKTYKLPVVVFADLEALLLPDVARPDTDKRKDTKIQTACTAAACLLVNGELTETYSYTGTSPIENLVEEIVRWHEEYNTNEHRKVPEGEYPDAGSCSICHAWWEKDAVKVRHHDHVLNKPIGMAHSACNAKIKYRSCIPVFFHNLKNYDGKHIVERLSYYAKVKFSSLITQSNEKFLTFTMEKPKENKKDPASYVQFIDSFAFLSFSLDKLFEEAPDAGKRYLHKHFPEFPDKKLATRFDEFNSWEMLKKPYVDEYGKEWERAGDYYQYYCLGDALILAGVFQEFREEIYKAFGLEACQFVSLPGLSWSAAMKVSKVVLKGYNNVEMYHLIKSNIRGGYTNAIVHYAKASEEAGPIQYFDICALYSWAMTQALPMGDFTRVDNDDPRWLTALQDDGIGFFVLGDWKVPKALHNYFSDLPLFARKEIGGVSLISDLRDKDKYLCHYRTAQQALRLGYKLTKTWAVYAFTQKPFFKSYIDANNAARALVRKQSKFKGDAYKLMNNSLYGKTIEDVEKYRKVKLRTRNAKLEFQSVEAPVHIGAMTMTFDERQPKATKPTYVGFAVLELSKWKMIDEWYNKFKPGGSKLLYMDTDSFIVQSPQKLLQHSDALGEFKNEHPNDIIDEFAAVRAKSYSIRFVGDKKDVVKMKGVSLKRGAVVTHEDVIANKRLCVDQFRMASKKLQVYSQTFQKVAINPEAPDTKRYQCPDGIHTLPWGHKDVPRVGVLYPVTLNDSDTDDIESDDCYL